VATSFPVTTHIEAAYLLVMEEYIQSVVCHIPTRSAAESLLCICSQRWLRAFRAHS